MRITLLPAADRIATPWKNGGGVTREVAAAPPGARMDAFDWRISIAEVRAGGPFSEFPGVDRVLTVLQGELSLAVGGCPPVRLTAASGPYAFQGDAACFGEPIGGPVTDLNLMLRRGGPAAHVQRLAGETELKSRTAVIVAGSAAVIQLAGESRPLQRHDAVRIDDACGVAVQLHGEAWAIEID